MCALNIQPELKSAYTGESVVNDFALMVATKNGSGSQTSNEVLIRSLFRMGIPVSAKNLFPSNIKGLPTWYTIRASKDSYIARRDTTEIGVVMNQDTAAEDIQNLPPGGVCIIPSDWKWGQSRQDITYYEVPVKETVAKSQIPSEFRDRISNMVYVGVCAQMFDIPLDIVRKALLDTFNGKEKPTAMNFGVVESAYHWAQENLVKADPFRFEPMNLTEGKILITGNEAAALGSLFGGVSVVAWYPITPSTSLVDGILDHKHIRKDAAGKDTVAVVQAEDELAAVGMIIGAGWAGARSLTSTSGPGISLMSEFVGLAYYAEIPCVIWDITRMGPSTGLPTRTSQGDLLSLHFLSHGDTRHIVLLPGSVAECFEFGWRSLDIADQFQTPVFVMSDLDLGMNIWMSDQFAYPDQPLNHGKALRDKDALDAFIADKGEWFRYRDYDHDAIPYRTLPGVDHMRAAYFTRGTGHTDMGTYSERGEDWVKGLQRITDKINNTRELLPQPIADIDPAKQIGILSFGSNHDAIEEARDVLTANGIHTNYMRVRSLPLAQSVHDFITSHQIVYVIENNFDGQLAQIIRMETSKDTTHMHSLALGDTLPMTAHWIVSEITKRENN
jgi:2-oxoglutarate ferredoxin oxidoreductase subunit alpha